MAYASTPFRRNLPRWAKVTGLIFLVLAQYLISGVNADIGPRVISYFGLNSDKLSFFLHISTVGMIVTFPLAYRFRDFFRRIDLLLYVLSSQLIIALLCVITYNESLLLVSSLLMGALKIICILDFLSLSILLFPMMRNRGLLYGIFYAFSRIMGEVSTYTSLTLMDAFNWSSIFILSAIAALLSIAVSLILFHTSRLQRKVPLYQIDWASVVLLLISGISLCYFFIMGKEKNWLDSPLITWGGILCLTSSYCFIYRQLHLKRPFWNLRIFSNYRQVILGIIIMLIMSIFHQSSLLYHSFIDYNFSNEPHYLVKITTIKIGTYLISFPLAGWLYYKNTSNRLLLFVGFLAYGVSLISFSSRIQPAIEYKNLFFSIITGSIGYAFTLTTAAAFASTNVLRKDNRDRAMASIYSRYILGSFIAGGLMSNGLFRSIQKNAYYLSDHISYSSPVLSDQLKKLTTVVGRHHLDHFTAHQQALKLLSNKVELQAMLVSLKDMTNWLGIAALLTAVTVLFIRKLEMHKIKGKNHYRIIPW